MAFHSVHPEVFQKFKEYLDEGDKADLLHLPESGTFHEMAVGHRVHLRIHRETSVGVR